MIWIMGNQIEAQILAVDIGLREYSWRRLSLPAQVLEHRRPNVVVMDHTFDWHPVRFAAITKALKLVGATFYTEHDLRDGKVPWI